MGMLEKRNTYKPFEYPWAQEAWETQAKVFWIPTEVPMANDVMDWKKNIGEREKSLIKSILTFFTQADMDVHCAYLDHYLPRIQKPEIRRMLTMFAAMETTHIVGYAYLNDTLGLPDSTYTDFLKYKAMVDKHEFNESFYSDSPTDLATTMAGFGAFVEGMQLFASFCLLLNFQRFGKLKGMGQIVAWSVRDETLHCQSTIQMFRTFVDEYDHQIDREELAKRVRKTCKHAVDCEDAFIDLVFDSGDMEGLTREEVKKFIRYIADLRMVQLGYEPMFGVSEDPLPWFQSIIGGVEHTSFFENKPTAYSKGATSGSWEGAFF